MAIVAPTASPIPVIVVIPRFSFVTKKTMYVENAVSGVCKVIEMIVTTTTPTTSRRVMAARPGAGANSCRSQERPSRCGVAKVSVAALIPLVRDGSPLDDGDGRRAHAEQVRVRVFDFDAHGKTLRDMHPVQ